MKCIKYLYEKGCVKEEVYKEDALNHTLNERYDSNLSLAMRHVNYNINVKFSNKRELLFLVTDGMANFNNDGVSVCYETNTRNYRDRDEERAAGPLGNCVGPIDIAMCEKIKRSGVDIAVVYTRYRDRLKAGNKEFENIVLPQLDLVEDHLKQCASPGLFEVSDFSGNMYEKIRSVFEKASMNLKLVH